MRWVFNIPREKQYIKRCVCGQNRKTELQTFLTKNLSLQSYPTPTALCNHDPLFHIFAELSAVIKATDSHPSAPAEEESERSAFRALPGLSHSKVLLRPNAFLMHASREKAASENMHLSAHFHRAFMVKVLCRNGVARGKTSALQASTP